METFLLSEFLAAETDRSLQICQSIIEGLKALLCLIVFGESDA